MNTRIDTSPRWATSNQNTASKPSTFVERAARIGYTAKGIVYLVIGGLAAAAAFGAGGKTTGSEGALETILRQPFGQVMLAVVALGLAGYAVWRFVQFSLDPENQGTDLEGLTLRGYYLTSAVIHSALIVTAGRMLFGSSNGSNGGVESQTATLMSQPYGRWLVGIVGLTVIGSAIYQFYRSWKAEFEDRVDYSSVSADTKKALVRLGRTGLAARGVVFGVIGSFFLIAALRANPDRAKGLGQSLATLEAQPYGPWLLAAVAIGLALYGVQQLVKARFREIG